MCIIASRSAVAVVVLGLTWPAMAVAMQYAAKAPIEDPGSNVIQLTEAHKGKAITANVGRTLVLRLPGDRATGATWQLNRLSGDAVQQVGRPEYVENDRGVGRLGGATVFKFQAVKPGRTSLKASFSRPGDKKSLNTYTVEILVKKP